VRAAAVAIVLALATPAVATSPGLVAANWKGDGELAVISDGRLLLDDNDGRSYVVAGAGAPSQPSWSPDGRWVAFLRTPAGPPLGAPVATLWTAKANGGDAHRVSAAGADATQFAWGPAAAGEELAFSTVRLPSYTSSDIYLASTSAPARRFATYSNLIDFSWAPSGTALAVSYRTVPEPDQPQAGKGFIKIAPVDGQAGRTVYTLEDYGYALLDGWWPDGKGLLFWTDPAGSASIAADGLALDSLELSDLKLRSLATTLVHQDWVAWSPDGKTVAVVAGGDREIWYSGKHVELCAIPAATCHAVPLPSNDVMSLDPAWSATGSFLYVLAPAVGPGPAPASGPTTKGGGWDPSGPWTTQNVAVWYGAQRLFSTGPTGAGAHVLAAVGTGAHNPAPTSHGLLYVQGGNLRYLPAGGRPVTVASGLQSPGPYANNYYGYIAWSGDFAWDGPSTTVGSTRTSVRSELAM
jgi:TolB protein